MIKLVSTTNAVRLSFLIALLKDAGIQVHIFDENIAALEAGIGAFPRRIMVSSKQLFTAKALLEAEKELYDD